MSVFLEISAQYDLTDVALGREEQRAFDDDDDASFDRAKQARQRNDQAYFLYLFTRFEAEVNRAVGDLLISKVTPAALWVERRIWEAWSRGSIKDIGFLSKVEVLTDKGRNNYAVAKRYYDGRNTIAHGDDWVEQFFVPAVAQKMYDIVQSFAVH